MILVIGCQRSGSNFLLSTMRHVEGLGVYGEMFHRQNIFPFKHHAEQDEDFRWQLFDHLLDTRADKLAEVVEKHSEHLGPAMDTLVHARRSGTPPDAEMATTRNRVLVGFAHRFVFAYISALRELTQSPWMMMKVFPEHMNIRELHTLISTTRPVVVFNLRDTLSTFISFQKLKKTQVPQRHDTTELKVPFDVAEYIEYVSEIRRFYFAARDLAEYHELPNFMLSYEDVHPEGRSEEDKTQFLAEELRKWTGRNWELQTDRQTAFTKQDKSASNAEKVLNPDALPDHAARIFYA